MSGEVTETFYRTQEIRLDVITTQTLQALEQAVCNVMKQRLEKLGLLIQNMNVSYFQDHLIINDRYKICKELVQIARAFGFVIEEVACGMRGATYVLTDPLIELMRQIGVSNYNVLSTVANTQIKAEHMALTERQLLKEHDLELLSLIANIRRNGMYISQKTQFVSVTTDGPVVLDYYEGEWDVDEQTLHRRLKEFAEESEAHIAAANGEMVAGTTQLIKYRARQMGYAVEEKKNGKEVQLVLVRLS